MAGEVEAGDMANVHDMAEDAVATVDMAEDDMAGDHGDEAVDGAECIID